MNLIDRVHHAGKIEVEKTLLSEREAGVIFGGRVLRWRTRSPPKYHPLITYPSHHDHNTNSLMSIYFFKYFLVVSSPFKEPQLILTVWSFLHSAHTLSLRQPQRTEHSFLGLYQLLVGGAGGCQSLSLSLL